MPDKDNFNAVLQPIVIDRAAYNQGENAQYQPHIGHSETMDSLIARGPHAVAFSCKDAEQDADEVSPTLRAMTHDQANANGGGQVAVAVGVDLYNQKLTGDVNCTLRASSGLAASVACPTPAVAHAMTVRRLTPVECERLQGFPDNYTLIPWRKKPAADCPDGPRYKALGNSMAVNCMEWIGERIAAYDGATA
jgi:DNA (cytosine-5)-methyltransferase 1